MRVLLVSTYDMGRQPTGIAGAAAWLERAGHDVCCCDVAVTGRLPSQLVCDAGLIAFHLPMHTATRLASALIAKVLETNPEANIACYGLYAPLNRDYLHEIGVQWVTGGEYEAELVRLADDLAAGRHPKPELMPLKRLQFVVPNRTQLPALDRYARLQTAGGPRTVGYTEATRGCLHHCTHCPIVPVYGGTLRVVQADVVLADIRQQVAAGARHITFGDPDFFNGPAHARRIVEALHAEWPDLTYDVTIKIEHLLRRRTLLSVLRDTGCLFVTSAAESVDGHVLEILGKGHTTADFAEAAGLLRALGLSLSPTFLPFTPWTTLESYQELLRAIVELQLVENVNPVQLAIRLLVPEGSSMLDLVRVQAAVAEFDPAGLCYRWKHHDPAIDALQRRLIGLVESMQSTGAGRSAIFAAVAAEAGLYFTPDDLVARAAIPYLDEPWFC